MSPRPFDTDLNPQAGLAQQRAHAPKRDYGILAESGFFVREPTGGGLTEKLPAVKAAGFAYVALNARDYPGNAWDEWRVEAARISLPVVPWGRVYDGARDAMTRALVAEDTIAFLDETRNEWGSPGVILNIEDEVEFAIPAKRVAELTADWPGSLAIATDYRGWMDTTKTPAVWRGPDYTPVADKAVGMMECFDFKVTAAIGITPGLVRLVLMGFKSRVPVLAANLGRDAYPTEADWPGSLAVYTLDTVAASEIAGWAP